MIVANSYIGGLYVPGEVLPDDLPEAQVAWLIKSGAACRVSEDGDTSSVTADAVPPDARRLAKAFGPTQGEGFAEDPQEEVVEPEDEADEAPEEIDLMEGLVQAEPPKPSRSRKKGGKGQ